jgi:general nucleoside transport system ATP-binding protein
MPFRVPLDEQVSSLSAGEKQKLEILKLLYLDQRFLILDEPTSVLTPGEADEVLGLLRRDGAARRGHRADDQPQVPRGEGVLRQLHRAAARPADRRGDAQAATVAEMSAHDDRRHGDPRARRARPQRHARRAGTRRPLAEDDEGRPAIKAVNLKVKAGEIVGIAGVSGNGQSRWSRCCPASAR